VKRSLVAILTVIYFAISSGVVMNVHYCMGKLSSVKLDAFGAKACACGKSEKKSCCKTELKVVKIEDVQKASYADFAFQLPVAPLFTAPGVFETALYHAPVDIRANGHSPPILSRQDTYLQNCVFRI
jgi:hypothetical protein